MPCHDAYACPEYNELTRRGFLAMTGAAGVALSAPAWLPRVALAKDYRSGRNGERDVLICLFLRGAADGLSICVPWGENEYYAARPTLAIARPDSSDPNRALDLGDGMFALNPRMAPLLPAYQNGHLLFVHAAGSNDPSRSHFDAQRYMEVGRPADITLGTGWLGRHIASIEPQDPEALLRAVGITVGLQKTLAGAPDCLPIPNLDRFGLAGSVTSTEQRQRVLTRMYSRTGDPIRTAAMTTVATIDLLNTIDFAGYQPAGGAAYPPTHLGLALSSTAALIKAEIGVEAIAIDVQGWDTHAQQGPVTGRMGALLADLANAVGAFYTDMFTGATPRVTLVVMSEFGRRLAENSAGGTDHGHGNTMMVLGQCIAGGRVLTQWPGLAYEQLFENLDLAVTIDYRDILAEILESRLGCEDLPFVFPGYSPTFRGVTTC